MKCHCEAKEIITGVKSKLADSRKSFQNVGGQKLISKESNAKCKKTINFKKLVKGPKNKISLVKTFK